MNLHIEQEMYEKRALVLDQRGGIKCPTYAHFVTPLVEIEKAAKAAADDAMTQRFPKHQQPTFMVARQTYTQLYAHAMMKLLLSEANRQVHAIGALTPKALHPMVKFAHQYLVNNPDDLSYDDFGAQYPFTAVERAFLTKKEEVQS